MANRSTSYTAHVIPHTHWDREWYQPFQTFRVRLVEVIDRVLDILERDPDFRSFTLDGQTVVLDDYLAVRPERRDDLRRFVREGRIHIGPWYVLADEFLVSPEALVRNLMHGLRGCRAFGRPMEVAYTPDSFGHISQLPLLAQGFGLDAIVFERGVGDEGEELGSEFRWIAADGVTEVFAVHLVGTYSAAAALGHRDWEMPGDYDRELAVAHARALIDGAPADLSDIPVWFRESLERVSGGLKRYSSTSDLILLNGSDHLFPQAELPRILADLDAAFDDVTFVHSDIERYLRDVRAAEPETASHQGEFRGSRYQHILSGVLSARMYLKQANHRAELRLERYAEPLAALAWRAGAAHPTALLRTAWTLLMQNHPHDSICGCSVDPVHREMLPRFDGAVQIGDALAERAARHLAGPEGSDALAVFHPLPQQRDAVVRHQLDLPAGSGATLGVRDADGNPLPSQTTVVEAYRAGGSDRRVDRTTVRFLAPLPPTGVAGFELGTDGAPPPPTDLDAGETHLENDHLRLEFDPDRGLLLTDKTHDRTFPLRLHLEDEADAGDSYDFSPLADDVALRVPLDGHAPALVAAGPVEATLRFEGEGRLPAELTADRRARSGEVALPFALDVTLEAASPLLRLRLELTNRARDHRLRLRLSTGRDAETVWADGHFDVLERPVRPPEGAGWFQRPQPTNHQRRFVALQGDAAGLAVLNRGLPEYEAIPTGEGVDLAVTLLRCVGWLSRDDLASRPQGAGPSLPAPEAQCLGSHTFDLALHPFAAPWWESDLLDLADAYLLGPVAWGAQAPPATSRFVELSPGLSLSALKRAEERDGLVVRVVNPAPRARSGWLELARAPRAVYRVRLEARSFLKHLQRELGVTAIYVTHDQAEAMALADRIVLMEAGRVVQMGPPLEVYRHPATTFVANFLGNPPMNLMSVRLERSPKGIRFAGETFRIDAGDWAPDALTDLDEGAELTLGIRPEHLRLADRDGPWTAEGELYAVEPLGPESLVTLRLGGAFVTVRLFEDTPPQVEERVRIGLDPERVHLFGSDGRRIDLS